MASTDLLAHDLLAYAWIKWAREFMTSSEEHAKDGTVMKNPNARNNAFLRNSWKLSQSTVITNLT
ncbi:MAG TPA: hypothetical protein VN203_08690, partial [Candidatus Acidoferrum sp.]|nr:hypothetical protein [Candidatus Acidoferrum sp.]